MEGSLEHLAPQSRFAAVMDSLNFAATDNNLNLSHDYAEVTDFSEEQKEKIRAMSQRDLPIEHRRAWYNAMGRRMKRPAGLKPGLVEKYQACARQNRQRFELLREFMVDENMHLGCT
jgi:hypothetical protein